MKQFHDGHVQVRVDFKFNARLSSQTSMSILHKARSALVVVGALYVGAVALLATVPWVQTQCVSLSEPALVTLAYI